LFVFPSTFFFFFFLFFFFFVQWFCDGDQKVKALGFPFFLYLSRENKKRGSFERE
jgi:hypothetical protein